MIANTSRWMRAPQSGILRAVVAIGARVEVGSTLAFVNDPLGENISELKSKIDGIVIGKTNLPLVFEGEAVFNIAAYEALDKVSDRIEAHHEKLTPNGEILDDDDEPALV